MALHIFIHVTQLGEIILPNVFPSRQAEVKKTCFTKEATPATISATAAALPNEPYI